MAKSRMTEAARFRSKYVKRASGCWEWIGGADVNGYGRFRLQHPKRAMVLAHRYAWEQANGPIPDGKCLLHKCDNPPCINHGHLFVGTRADNIRDMDAKGRRRSATGIEHGSVKLTETDVCCGWHIVSATRCSVRGCVVDMPPNRHS